jgi:DNA repair protein RecO (recombination protein O)
MEWQGDGLILNVRRHGETSAIIDVLTRERGRHSGLVRGGRSRTQRPVLQAGNLFTWCGGHGWRTTSGNSPPTPAG